MAKGTIIAARGDRLLLEATPKTTKRIMAGCPFMIIETGTNPQVIPGMEVTFNTVDVVATSPTREQALALFNQ